MQGDREGQTEVGRLPGVRKRHTVMWALQVCEGISRTAQSPAQKTPIPPSHPLGLTPSRPHLPPSRLYLESHNGGNLMENTQLDLEKNISR